MNLFQLSQQYQQLADNDELDPTVIADTLDSINDAWEDKLNNIAKWCESLDSDIDFLTKKKRSISDELSYRKNLWANLMTYLTSAIDDRGLKEVHTDDYILRPRNYKQRTVIDDEDKIPGEYRNYAKYQGMYDIKKNDVYKALKDGKEVPGAHLEPNRKTSIK
ncbi:Gp157 family protein (plasmid) [Limosilactobacillus reuteri I5007]|uniref:Gp157 family protein n=1 Tax=Limosilactobacillus reuteri I5007 TaxID=1340495 RepID=R9WKD8_LIMRT|nr:siphovirus Gp157 family protein [Limosilactobacillus reuteri]AGO00194.1 Gp157 family protein [Limosilactobacillus reuteri I5007]